MLLQDTQAELQCLPAGCCSGTSGQVKWSTARSRVMSTASNEQHGLFTRKYQSPPNCGVIARSEASVLLAAAASPLSCQKRVQSPAPPLSWYRRSSSCPSSELPQTKCSHFFSYRDCWKHFDFEMSQLHKKKKKKKAFNLPILFLCFTDLIVLKVTFKISRGFREREADAFWVPQRAKRGESHFRPLKEKQLCN